MTPQKRRGRPWLQGVGLAVVLALSVLLYTQRAEVQALRGYGYVGLFFFALLTSASVILPMPGLVLPYVLGGVLNPWGVALAAGSGAALGELTGYLAGWSGKAFIEDDRRYDQVRAWMQRYGAGTIFVLAYLPLPLMDLAGIVAGATRMPLSRFLFWCWLGKVLKMLTVAFLGALSLPLNP